MTNIPNMTPGEINDILDPSTTWTDGESGYINAKLAEQQKVANAQQAIQKAAFDLLAIAAETQTYGLECVRKVRENLQTGLDTCFKNAVKRIETWGAG